MTAIRRIFVCLAVLAATAGAILGAAPPAGAVAPPLDAVLHGYVVFLQDGTVVFRTGDPTNDGEFNLDFGVDTVAAEVTPDGVGLVMLLADNDIATSDDALFHGSLFEIPLNEPVMDLDLTPGGAGYWISAVDGGVFAFGDAGFHGSMGGRPLNEPIVGMASTPSGKGYWLVASDGGIFAFGDAGFYGSMGGTPLNKPVVGMLASPDGRGYWLVASDGGVFAFGKAGFHGSLGSLKLVSPIKALEAGLGGRGYWMLAEDGGVFSFDVPFFGSATGYGSPAVDMVLDFELAELPDPPDPELQLPTAAADAYTAIQDTELSISGPGVLTNDVDPLGGAMTAVVGQAPGHGDLVLDGDGGFTYTPDVGYTGADSFTYRAENADGLSDLAVVAITVAAKPRITSAWADDRGTRDAVDAGDVHHFAFSQAMDDAILTGSYTFDGANVICGQNAACAQPSPTTLTVTLTSNHVGPAYGTDLQAVNGWQAADVAAPVDLEVSDVTIDANPAPSITSSIATDNGTVGNFDSFDTLWLNFSEDLADVAGAAITLIDADGTTVTILCGTEPTYCDHDEPGAPNALRVHFAGVPSINPTGGTVQHLQYPATITALGATALDNGVVTDLTGPSDVTVEADERPTLVSATGVDHREAGELDGTDTITLVFSEPMDDPGPSGTLVIEDVDGDVVSFECNNELSCVRDLDKTRIDVTVQVSGYDLQYPVEVKAVFFDDLDYGSQSRDTVGLGLTPVVTLRIDELHKDTANPTSAALPGDKHIFTFSEAVHADIAGAGSSYTLTDVTDRTLTVTCGGGANATCVLDSPTQMTVTLPAGAIPALTYPATVTAVSGHWKTAAGDRVVNLADSLDHTVEPTPPDGP